MPKALVKPDRIEGVVRKRISQNLRTASDFVRKEFADDILAEQLAVELGMLSRAVGGRRENSQISETFQRLTKFVTQRFAGRSTNQFVVATLEGAALTYMEGSLRPGSARAAKAGDKRRSRTNGQRAGQGQ